MLILMSRHCMSSGVTSSLVKETVFIEVGRYNVGKDRIANSTGNSTWGTMSEVDE